MPHVVKALPYHRKPGRAASHIAYITRGESDVPGRKNREVYGLGDRYKEVSKSIADPNERRRALERLLIDDAGKVHRPTFHSHIFTLDNDAAIRFAAMDRPVAEQRLRHCLNETFRASAFGRRLQGLYAIHWDGGYKRPAHPHIHVVYSPLQTNGRPIYVGPRQLAQVKAGWNRAVDGALSRAPAKAPLRAAVRPLDAGKRAIRTARRAQAFVRNPARSAVRVAGTAILRGILQPPKAGRGPTSSPEALRAASRVGMYAASLALRLALGKLSIPREIARAILSLPLDQGRSR